MGRDEEIVKLVEERFKELNEEAIRVLGTRKVMSLYIVSYEDGDGVSSVAKGYGPPVLAEKLHTLLTQLHELALAVVLAAEEAIKEAREGGNRLGREEGSE